MDHIIPLSVAHHTKLIAALDLSREHAQWLHDALTDLPAHACYRAMILRDIGDHVRQHHGNAAAADFKRFWEQLSIPSVYRMIHVSKVVLTMLKVGDFGQSPSVHPVEKLYRSQQQIVGEFVHINPLMQILYKACRDDLFEFIRMQVQGIESWQNFGHVHIEEVSNHQMRVHYDDVPTTLLSPGIRALYEGTLTLFTGHAQAHVEIHDTMSATVHLQRRI